MHTPIKLNIFRLKNMIECPYRHTLYEHANIIKRMPYWHKNTIILTLIKRCWQELSLPLDFDHIQVVIQARLAELIIYMDTDSPHFWFDKMYILQLVTAWFRYECQRQDPSMRITHDAEPIILNEHLILDVDRIEHLPDGTKRYMFYTFSVSGLRFMGQVHELQQYDIALAHLDWRRCRVITLKPHPTQISLENVAVHPVHPRRCLPCYLKNIMLQK